MSLRITVLGRGAWGGTLLRLWERQGHRLSSWSRRDGGDPTTVLKDCDLVVVAVSMVGVAPLASQLQERWPVDLPLLSCSKGIDLDTLCTASQLWRRHLPDVPLAVLSGPNLADELERGLPAASVLSSQDQGLARQLQDQLRAPHFRLYTNADPIGTEAAGALKNVIALAAGISDGLGLGANAKASLLCRGLAEMSVVLQALGGQPSTLYGLAGLGDLLATANSSLSRNYRFGTLLAEGCDEITALARIGATVEGTRTARATLALAEREGWQLPICGQVVRLLAGRVEARQAVQELMQRDLKPEAAP
ncbi:NAD(P)H-dependent glycerol-3-phosphate dehydrogenase [Cyanobium sp. N5-Cardenillas]|uniref:NAD(P)H-dependent glycerol-3-phosphate dehydrogenase n=1 Tax=Cyanobium sp. N5-Cardenillas TaxID=2823720 RepID=UPI0020CBCD28|nr:NAD(P)H-dependent glycerol-3-phosphate dehydrogenase [Cyanobium sp. N5-Cardenillas]MCP9786509.1 NAD(P)H-dependent glycerol-3-phosphate dehydrogenase [Cyanobium sp. N5-Cardenillas]